MALIAGFVFFIQGISLLRNYPASPACGRVIEVFSDMSVLINCDSAVFMKDAQNPLRVLDGQSVYQDRPAHSILVWIMSVTFRLLGIPNVSREVVGNSGEVTVYQSVFYASFLILNTLILVIATFIALKSIISKKISAVFTDGVLVPAIIVLIVTANELTKTFFWTPHSQMFNILLPVLGFFLIKKRSKVETLKEFFLLQLAIFLLMFFYPLFGILYGILLFSTYSKFSRRIFLTASFIITYLLYPRLLTSLGGNYSNFAVAEYRQYIWPFDALKQGNLIDQISVNFKSFILTFPLFPTLLLSVLIVFLSIVTSKPPNSVSALIKEQMPYLMFFALYICALSMMGYYSRRLTLGPFIFLELAVLNFGISRWGNRSLKVRNLFLYGLIGVLIVCWIATNGPLS